MTRWREVHRDYCEMMEEILTAIVVKNNGTIEQFMRDVKYALDGGEGFLFEDENYADFVQSVQAMDDYAAFHRLMIDAAGRNRSMHK